MSHSAGQNSKYSVRSMIVLLAAILVAGALPLRAASTGQAALYMPQGSGAGTANGDYVTATGGLNTFYRYFIEVPPGLTRLVVEVFDPDVGRGGATEDDAGRDRDRNGGSFVSTATYTLLRPDGSTAATLSGCNNATCNDNVWQTVLDSTTAQNTAAGHWELRVTMGGDSDINAIGVRAHDGTSGAGGTELSVYYDSQNQFGVNPASTGANSRSYTFYPYITAGCSAFSNDFDFDSASTGNTTSMSYISRDGSFTQNLATATLSTDNTWQRDTLTGWTSDTKSAGYGIWTGSLTITTYTVGGTINGNYGNVWLSNFQAPSAIPNANPNTNAFRVYLPNDAGTAPVKPYVEQQATFSGCGVSSGPNPPVVGQTSCFTVTVKVVNPAAQAITFSAANLVTANVPGSGAVYAGTPQVSQGSIVSQPAVGGTGNITWNPGTLAAGATALLAYRVRVTPTSAGQRIPLTATPASGNGTRAQFVDTTGNTTQTRATYLFGPLCELAVTENLLTQAVVSSFRASPADGGGVLLEWQTASEAGTVGFYVERWDDGSRRWVRVNRELLAGLLHSPQGGTYRFVDDGASPSARQTYRLVEVEAAGRRQTYGPFRVAVDWQRPDPRCGVLPFEREAHTAARRALVAESGEEPAMALRKGLGRSTDNPDGVHLSIKETGLYSVKAADVANWFGLTAEKAAKMIAEGKLSLTRNDQAVAWYPDFPPGARDRDKAAQGLFFYGEGPDSLYTDASVYRLQKDKVGLLMAVVPAGTAAPGAGGNFPDTLHSERDLFAATVIGPDPESDYWFWEFLQGSDPSFGHRTFTLDSPGVVPGLGGALTVSLQGATASGVTDEHQAAVSLNGTALGETRWTGITARKATFAIPPGLLRPTGNQVDISAATGAGAPFSFFYVDSFDLAYQRTFRANGNSLTFTPGGNSQVTVGGFNSAAVRLIDVQDPLHPRWIGDAAPGQESPGSFRLAFAPTPQGKYLATTVIKSPAAVRAWSAPFLRSTANRADYVVIAPASLRDAAERLANLRRAQGLEAIVADLDQIMDELNAGAPSPHALRAFLAFAATNWSKPPRYVALAGEGTLDYRNLLGFGDNLVPPLMVQSQGGLFPSDNLLGDVDGANGDGLPEMSVGRIPILSAAELDAYTSKIAAYESAATADWAARAVMVADAPDRGADFTADSERIAGQVDTPYTLDRVYLSATPFAAARSQLLADIGGGSSFINYMGHGALDRLSASGLLTSSDVPGLANGSRLPVLTAMTCTVNRFAVPGIPALGELLVKSPSGGAAAVWGPSGLSANAEARLLAERFYHPAGAERLGDRILRAIAEFRGLGGDPALPRIYDLLGDPALRVPVPPAPAPVPGSSGE